MHIFYAKSVVVVKSDTKTKQIVVSTLEKTRLHILGHEITNGLSMSQHKVCTVIAQILSNVL